MNQNFETAKISMEKDIHRENESSINGYMKSGMRYDIHQSTGDSDGSNLVLSVAGIDESLFCYKGYSWIPCSLLCPFWSYTLIRILNA